MAEARESNKELRDAIVQPLVVTGVTILLQVAVLVAVAKRDQLRRVAAAYRWHVLQEWRGAHERQLIAELRRDVSRMEHEGITDAG